MVMTSQEAVIEALEEMTAEDRCDACGARAMYRLASPTSGSAIDLCNHHGKKNAAALEAKGWTMRGAWKS